MPRIPQILVPVPVPVPVPASASAPVSFARRGGLPLLGAALLLALAGCASSPRPPSSSAKNPADDGPPAAAQRELDSIPDAVPRIEPLAYGANQAYTVLGRRYVPLTGDERYPQHGMASWYGRQFHGRKTSSGEVYDMFQMTSAHPTLPIPSYVRVRHLGNGRSVIVRVNDRGPFSRGRIIDLSYAAARKLGLLQQGHAKVAIERITHAEIRAGSWNTTPGAERLAGAADATAAGADLAD